MLSIGVLAVFCAVVYWAHESDREARAEEVSTILRALKQERATLDSLKEENSSMQ